MQGEAGTIPWTSYGENLFLSRIWENGEIFYLKNFRLHGIAGEVWCTVDILEIEIQ